MSKLFICFLLGFQPGCATPTKPINHIDTTLCVIRPAEKQCWIDKDHKLGIPLEKIDGYFGVSPDDLDDIVFRLSQCKGE